jgi:hypothetical protein
VVSWPSQQEYNEAIQEPRLCFEDSQLRTGKVECNQLGLPRPRAGNFATVYKMEAAGKKWAVKCFTRQTLDQHQRYAAINSHLHQVALPYVVDFSFLTRGILVRGNWYPIVKMEWAEGEPLHIWLEKNLRNSTALLTFSKSFVAMLSALRRASVAHGDLQHGNILVINSSPKLVDYDGMYVPALSGKLSNELGQPNYQHPRRAESEFGPNLDNFSSWVILVSLVALSVDPKLWQTFKGGDDCLLFRKSDFVEPQKSTLIKAIESESNPELRQLMALFRTVIACSPLSVPAIDGTFALPSVPPSSPQTGASWIQDHLTPTRSKPVTVSITPPAIDWILDSTHTSLPPLQFSSGVVAIRLIAYLTLALVALSVELALQLNLPALMISLPFAVGANLLIWRSRYRSDPTVTRKDTVIVKQREFLERLRVKKDRIGELDVGKSRVSRRVSDHRTQGTKEENELLAAEQKANAQNDSRLQTATSGALSAKQKLDGQEVSELTSLQNNLGRTLAGLKQTLGSLGQAESTELNNALRTRQRTYVQERLQEAWLATSQIQGIGAGYKSRLQAAGIYTAADIDFRIHSVKGIGAQRAASLEAWRNTLEADALSKMPRSLLWQEENTIKSRYANQKTNLELQVNQTQQEINTREGSIRTKYSIQRAPHEALVAAERQNHTIESVRIAEEFKQKHLKLTAKIKEFEDGAVQEVSKLDDKQSEIRREMFELQWRMAKVERELAQFSQITFPHYIRRVLLFS